MKPVGVIRAACREDVKELAALSQASMRYSWSEQDFAEALTYSQAKVYLCEQDGQVLGYAILYHAADQGDVPSIAVRHSARRQRVGSRLLEHVFGEAYTLGVRKLFLEVRDSNDAAQRLYETMGFLRISVRKGFYDQPREDAVVMMRILQKPDDRRIEVE